MLEQWVHHDRLQVWLLTEAQRRRPGRLEVWEQPVETQPAKASAVPRQEKRGKMPRRLKPGLDYFTS